MLTLLAPPDWFIEWKQLQEQQTEEIRVISRHIQYQSAMVLRDINPWENMSSTNASRAPNLRTKFSEVVPIECMVTKITKTDIIVAAHILPCSTKPHICESLGMVGQLNDFRNLLWLCKGIEESFDSQQLSIIPERSNPFHAYRYHIHIWDQSILNKKLYKCENKKWKRIKDIVHNTINFTEIGHLPFRRCLSYQAFVSYCKWNKLGIKVSDQIIKAEDFDISDYEGDIKTKINDYLKIFLEDKKLEVDNDESNEV